jgi:hypothetical protein
MPKRAKSTRRTPTAEAKRLAEDAHGKTAWKRWGPYVSERAWGTVREDYSPHGTAWDYFPHDHARSRAYRWGEDGLAGICDRYQLLVFAVALWNGHDPILKERAFGLVPSEGNHGEDVKEYFFYLDSTPTHSYMKYLYKYPQAAYPYVQLIEENRRRQGNGEPEYEFLDTGIFDDNRYFDVFVEYAKAGPEDLCIRIEVCNRGLEAAPIHILPHLWFRNRWAWEANATPEPSIQVGPQGKGFISLTADDSLAEPLTNLLSPYHLGLRYLYGDAGAQLLFTNNETHAERVWGPWAQSRSPYVKDAFHRHIINGEECVNPKQTGTKACFHYAEVTVPAHDSVVIRLRLTDKKLTNPLTDVDTTVSKRREEADAFYTSIHPPNASEDERQIQRQALAGMLWNKQIYLYDVKVWLHGDNPHWPPPESRHHARNTHWRHLNSQRILSVPDKWEFPWFAAWDLAFHCITLALVDPVFAKEQLWLLLFEQFQHPNGQIPAYEWEFSDLNPPVQAWAIWRVYNMDRQRSGTADRQFLEQCFHKLLLNFTWWVNKVDSEGNNIFEGGFLGLDNITVIDRSHEKPHGAKLEQSDATGWMGMFCLNMMRIALELAKENKVYEALATKFFEHYVYIGVAMKKMGNRNYQLWDETDGFFYDVLRYPNGEFHKFRVRSLVGLIPLYAIERLEEEWIAPFAEFRANLHWFLRNRQDLVQQCVITLTHDGQQVHVLAIMNPEQIRQLLERVWDPNEFRSPYGVRSLSRYHEQYPFLFGNEGVEYEPGESRAMQKGGNSNWRGPVWLPTTFLLIESLRKLRKAYGATFTIEDPTDRTNQVTLDELARGLANSQIRLFTRNEHGERPIHGNTRKFHEDPHWRDCLLFYEHFHADTGRGLGASHQTGWTGLVASLIDEWRQDK